MFYEQFAELCKEKKISPSIVAETIGLNRSSVTFWKRGSTPKGETLRKLANYFGVSVDYLLNKGQRINPLSPSRRIFSVMNEQNVSLLEMRWRTGISSETIRCFALGEKVENGRDCLDKIAEALHANPAYLMGWTSHEDDKQAYIDITKEMWELSGNDPDAAHGLQQSVKDQEYQQLTDDTEYQRTKNQAPELFKVGDSYYDGALRISDVEEKSDSEFSVTFQLDEDGMEVDALVSFFEILQSMSSKHGVSIDGLAQLAKMVEAVAAKEPVQDMAPVPSKGRDTTPAADVPETPPEDK